MRARYPDHSWFGGDLQATPEVFSNRRQHECDVELIQAHPLESVSTTWLDVVVEVKLRCFREADEVQDVVFVHFAKHNTWW